MLASTNSRDAYTPDPRPAVEVFLGVGSNTQRQRHLRIAICDLQHILRDIRCSPVYESAAIGLEAPAFHNLVVRGSTCLQLPKLSRALKKLELKHGRNRESPAVVTLDVDILIYGEREGCVDGRVLPSEELLTRAYVLKPMSQLAPEKLHPLTGLSYASLWAEFELED